MITDRTRALVGVLLATGTMLAPGLALAQADILPRPAMESALPGKGFALKQASRIVAPSGDEAAAAAARYLQEKLATTLSRKVPLAIGDKARTGDIVLALDAAAPEGDEAYTLKSDDGRMKIAARSGAGLFYGAVSAWELLSGEEGLRPVPAVAIEDKPRFAWRGLMLDSARHMQSVEYIKSLIDVMAVHKFNRLHWHLTDDQGWRIEIPEYPRLTSVGAWRKAVGPDLRDARTNSEGMYGGFYTQDEIREIVAYAAARHIAVVPEIDLPGHATALLAAYPQLGVPEFKAEPVTSDWGLLPEVVNVDEPTLATIKDILDKVMALFPAPYIHLGGDEADKTQWQGSPTVQARMKALGIHDEDALERWFIAELGKHVATKGRTLIGWDEIQEGESGSGLAKDTLIMTWRAGPGARKALAGGHRILMAQSPVYYLNNRQERTADEPPGWTDIISLERVYRNDPIPDGVSAEEASRVYGLQAQLWTERVRKEEWATRLLFPRASAVAEVAWSPADKLDWAGFLDRMAAQQARYRQLGMGPTGPLAPAASERSATRRTSLELDFCDTNATGLVVEGPSSEAQRLRVVNHNPCWIWRGAALSSVKSLALQAAKLPFSYRLGHRAPVVHLPSPTTPEGEIELRLDAPDGPLLASLPLGDFADDAEIHRFDTQVSAQGVHDIFVVVTGKPIDNRIPFSQRPDLIAVDWIELE